MSLPAAIERRNKLQAAYDALLMGDRVVDIKFEDHSATYAQVNIKALETELNKARTLVNQLSGKTMRARPHKIRHSGGY